MKKKEQGILTIEASIVLTLFLLFVLFLFSFARMYRAQNMISHATMQSADALALESYIREVAHDEDANEIVKLGNQLSGLTSLSEESFTSLRAADIPKLAKEKFAVAISSSDANADAILKKLGVKGGLSGVDFSVSKMDLNTNDVIVYANYTLELQFPVFGFSEINVTKAARAKTFGDILFEISTISNDDRKGTASGGGSYKHGTTIEITAEPKYGYYFEGWDDDGDGDVDYDGGKAITASKRTVTVTDAKTYTAIFKNNGFGVNASVNPAGIEGITIVPGPNAQGLHEYGSKVDVTVSHNNSHYTFSGWSGQLLQDKNSDGFEESVSSIPNPKNNLTYTIPEVQGNYHLTANFTPKQYNVNVSVKDGVGGTAVIAGTNKSSTKVTYPNTVSLSATPAWGYAIDYWMKDGSIIQSSYGQSTISNEQITGNTNYTVVFKNIKVKVTFVGPNDETLDSFTLNKGQSFNDARLNVPSYKVKGGKIFDGWKDFSSSTPINGDTKVRGNWSSPSIQIKSGASTNVNSTTLSVTKFPTSGTVTWSSADTSKASVDSNGKVTANAGSGKVVVTATLEYEGLTASDSVTIELDESEHQVVYCMNMASNGKRYYTKSHTSLNKKNKWGVYFPGTNHHCHSFYGEYSGCCSNHANKVVGYTTLHNSKVVSTANDVVHKVGTYSGYNKSGEKGYIFNNGTGNAIYFELKQTTSGPRGFYIKKITY